MNPQNNKERAEVVKSMETIARCINDYYTFKSWLSLGVADCDINDETTLEEIVEMGYCEDATYKDLMTLFLKLMTKAGNDGGLFSDGIVSGTKHIEWR